MKIIEAKILITAIAITLAATAMMLVDLASSSKAAVQSVVAPFISAQFTARTSKKTVTVIADPNLAADVEVQLRGPIPTAEEVDAKIRAAIAALPTPSPSSSPTGGCDVCPQWDRVTLDANGGKTITFPANAFAASPKHCEWNFGPNSRPDAVWTKDGITISKGLPNGTGSYFCL